MCYSACLFSAKDTLERILPEISVPDNATCEHYCTLKVSSYVRELICYCLFSEMMLKSMAVCIFHCSLKGWYMRARLPSKQ